MGNLMVVVTRFLSFCAVLLALAPPEASSATACREGVVSSTGEVKDETKEVKTEWKL